MKPNLIVVFQIPNSELTDTFFALTRETELITEGENGFYKGRFDYKKT